MQFTNEKKDRTNQRYTSLGEREVAVALILAWHSTEWALVFVTSRNHPNKLTLPKGGWEFNETVEDAARREALEEGGVLCKPASLELLAALQHWEHQTVSNESKQSKTLLHVIPLLFDNFEEKWLEQHERLRFMIPVSQIIEGDSVLVGADSFKVKAEFRSIVCRHFSDENFLAIVNEISSS